MTDQEQTERGASTKLRHRTEVVEDIAKFPTLTHRHGCPNLDEPVHHACLQEADGAVVRFRLATPDELRADLERVTAETKRATDHWVAFEAEAHRWQDRAEQAEAERDAMREVIKVVRDHASPRIKHLLPTAWHPLCDALTRLDATRKATADAAEEGK